MARSPVLAPLDSIPVGRLPSHFADYSLAQSSYDVARELPSLSTTPTYLIQCKDGRKLVLKCVPLEGDTLETSASFYALTASLIPLRFYFLAPIQAFTATFPLGFFYAYYEDTTTLRDFIKSGRPVDPTTQTLLVAFVCYAMAFLEANQQIHGCLHSGNVLVTGDLLPIVTDFGLARTYDLFKNDTKTDDLAWVAPEMLLGARANYSVDMHSFGVLLFELFERRRPFARLTNQELLVGRRFGKLDSLDFERTPDLIRKLIAQCCDVDPDCRPSFCELYYCFQTGSLHFPGADPSRIKRVLAHYPVSQIFAPEGMPMRPEEPRASVDRETVISSPRHPGFRDAVVEAASSANADVARQLCDMFAGNFRAHQKDAAFQNFALTTARTLMQRAPDAVISSPFFTKVVAERREEAAILFDLLRDIFVSGHKYFDPHLYQSVGYLVLHFPAEMTNLLSAYFTRFSRPTPTFWDNVRFLFGLWFLFYNSTLCDKYIRIIGWLVATYPELLKVHGREIAGIVARFTSCPGCVLEAAMVTLTVNPDGLTATKEVVAALTRDERRRHQADTVLLCARSIAPSVETAKLLVNRAVGGNDKVAWALLLKYARQGEAHAQTLLAVISWAKPAPGMSFEYPLRVLLAVFLHPSLRRALSRQPEFPVFLRQLCLQNRADLLHTLCSLFQRVPIDPEFVTMLSISGFLASYLGATLEAHDQAIVKFGLILMDVYARRGYADEWVGAVQRCISLIKFRMREFGEDLIKVMSTLSQYQQCMALMKDEGLEKYYRDLLGYEPLAEFAKFFLKNAAALK
jgi:hypothetical protein